MMDIRQPEDLRQLRPRLQGMVLIVLLAFIALLSRLCQLQVLEGEHYVRRAERNFIETIEVEAWTAPDFLSAVHDIAGSLAPDAKVVLIQADSGERWTVSGGWYREQSAGHLLGLLRLEALRRDGYQRF